MILSSRQRTNDGYLELAGKQTAEEVEIAVRTCEFSQQSPAGEA